ncbi:hypothetical protein [Actinoplanes xinjiangensis]|uniref:Uncharacterized protein n=1 Tax=Actinoplanes xinjiangensis TaxID=512350 RepID=A0A316FWI7_9ACTN|nr:hypothetical protein [Actinoplanes xinjiangensis]PWK52702.1 hypothetical protein BC793_101711 [Actinoplanes xinjiangensis]GIF36605.1 hypothetical protein Axi01nite_09160 [Actinoplanes xinjiangensis]
MLLPAVVTVAVTLANAALAVLFADPLTWLPGIVIVIAVAGARYGRRRGRRPR